MPETAGAVLGPHALQAQYPHFVLCDDPSMTIEALCHEVRKNRIRTELQDILVSSTELAETDITAAINKIATGSNYLQNLGMAKRSDVPMDEAMGRVMQRYALQEQGVDLSVCSWPWPPLQEATGGIDSQDYIVIYGRPKSMKTWLLVATLVWAFEQGKRILIYTKEMTADNIFKRIAAVMAKVRYHELRMARLSPEEKAAMDAVWRMIYMMRATQPLICLSGQDTGEKGDTVPWLRSKIEQYKPDMVFIDGMYLMSDARGNPRQKDHERVQHISRDLRQMNLETKLPLVCTLQANRDAAKNKEANLEDIAFSDAIGQDATLAIRVINEKGVPTLALLIGGSREFELNGFRTYGVPAVNFDYFGPLSTGEALQAAQQDAEAAKQVKKRNGASGTPSAGGVEGLRAQWAAPKP